MKTEKLKLAAILLAATILVMAVCTMIICTAKTPTITEQDFPFSITYELNGKTETLESVYTVRFRGIGDYVDTTARMYDSYYADLPDGSSSFILSDTADGIISLEPFFDAAYMMGEKNTGRVSDGPCEPRMVYSDAEGYSYIEEDILAEHGAKLISWEYPAPIENTYKFSHIASMSGNVILPQVIIGLLGLLAVIIFVKKDPEAPKNALNTISVILNYIITLVGVPMFTIFGLFSDITGSDEALAHQFFYLIPAITLLCLAASVALRRKGFTKGGFFTQLAGPVIFVVYYILAVL